MKRTNVDQQSLKNGNTIKVLCKGTTARFVCYRDGELWYQVIYGPFSSLVPERNDNYAIIFEFPVPVADTGNGIFESEMKAITLMRWIRKQYEQELELAKTAG